MATYCLYEIEETHGYTHNQVLFTLHWFDVDTLQQYTMTVDPLYRNYTKNGWQHIIEHNSLGFYANIHQQPGVSRRRQAILNADSVPQQTEALTDLEILEFVEIRSKNMPARQPVLNTIHRGLFEIDLARN